MAWGLDRVGSTWAKHRPDVGLLALARRAGRAEGKMRNRAEMGVKISGKVRQFGGHLHAWAKKHRILEDDGRKKRANSPF